METGLNQVKNPFTSMERRGMCRLVFLFIFFSLAYSYYSGTLLHQLCFPVLKFPYVDPTYWAIHLLKIPEWLTQNFWPAFGFDAVLVATCLLCIFFPDRRWLIAVFFILYFFYFISFNSYSTLHTHSKIGILMMPVPFIVFRNKSFTFLWEGMRYFTLFVYADAFLWKLFRNTFMNWEQGGLIIKANLTPYLYFHPSSFQTSFYTWLLQHDHVAGWLFNAGMLMEASFLIGFFTKKFDKYLFVFSILLPAGFICFADAFFFELTILSLTLINFRAYRGNIGLSPR